MLGALRALGALGSAAAALALVASFAGAASASVRGAAEAGALTAPAPAPAPPAAAAPAAFVPVAVQRVVDTRTGLGGVAPLAAGSWTDITVPGCPAGTTAMALNVTGTEAVGRGFVTVTSPDSRSTATSTLNLEAGATRAGFTVVPVDAAGRISVYSQSGTQLVVDLFGCFVPTGGPVSAGRLVATATTRVLDTRIGLGGLTRVRAGTTTSFAVPGAAGASAVALNLTAVGANAPGWVAVTAAGTFRWDRLTSNVNVLAREARAAAVIVPVSADGRVEVSASMDVDVVVDLAGTFSGPSAAPGTDGLFVAHAPVRTYDSRLRHVPPVPGAELRAAAGDALAVWANVTAADADGPGWLAAHPAGTYAGTSTVNFDLREISPNGALVPVAGGALEVRVGISEVHVVVDQTGAWVSGPVAAAGYVPPPPFNPGADPRIRESRRLGESVLGRPITAYRLGDPAGVPVLVVGVIHGNESSGLEVALELRDRAAIPTGIDLWVIPAVNPDGLRAAVRTNARGVDLNRNFPESFRSYPCTTSCPGAAPLSEPEAAAVAPFILAIKPAVSVWYHAAGSTISADSAAAVAYAARVGYATSDVPCFPLGSCSGTATMFTNATVPGSQAFVVELPSGQPGSLSDAEVADHVQAVWAAAATATR